MLCGKLIMQGYQAPNNCQSNPYVNNVLIFPHMLTREVDRSLLCTISNIHSLLNRTKQSKGNFIILLLFHWQGAKIIGGFGILFSIVAPLVAVVIALEALTTSATLLRVRRNSGSISLLLKRISDLAYLKSIQYIKQNKEKSIEEQNDNINKQKELEILIKQELSPKIQPLYQIVSLVLNQIKNF